MRSFSNIIPNFAANLHLLVDSIKGKENGQPCKLFPFLLFYSMFSCTFAR